MLKSRFVQYRGLLQGRYPRCLLRQARARGGRGIRTHANGRRNALTTIGSAQRTRPTATQNVPWRRVARSHRIEEPPVRKELPCVRRPTAKRCQAVPHVLGRCRGNSYRLQCYEVLSRLCRTVLRLRDFGAPGRSISQELPPAGSRAPVR